MLRKPTLMWARLSPMLLAAMLLAPFMIRGPRTPGSPAEEKRAVFVPTMVQPAAPVSAPLAADVASSMERNIERREYRPSRQTVDWRGRPMPERLHFVNRANNVRAYFDERGVQLLERTTKTEPAKAVLRTESIGRGRSEPLRETYPRIDGDRVVYDRGSVLEFYTNAPEGIEQLFRIADRPAGEGELVIAVRLEGDVEEARVEGGAVRVRLCGGAEFEYGKLLVSDARGETVPSRLEFAGSSIRLCMNDASAAYPILVDPLIANPVWQAEGNTGSSGTSNFGFSAARAGDVNGDGFDDLIVGAYLFDHGQPSEGAAFVWYGSTAGFSSSNVLGTTLSLVAIPDSGWAVESNQAGASLGVSVEGAGDVNGDGFDDVIIGSYLLDNGETNEGAAFVFYGSAAGLPIADGGTGLAAVTAPDASWAAEANQTEARFGRSVAGAGDVNGDGFDDIIIGAFLLDNGTTDEGAAFVYHGSASGLAVGDVGTGLAGMPAPDASWAAESNQATSNFGLSAADAGDVNGDGFDDIIIGARFLDNGSTNEGGAFVYYGSSTGLPLADGGAGLVGLPTPDASWAVESNQAQGRLGQSVANAGDVNGDLFADIIMGAYLFDSAETSEGAVFVYYGSSTGLSAVDGGGGLSGTPTPDASWAAECNQAGASLGIAVAGAGDLNGDSFDDIVVGAYLFDGIEVNEGAAFVYYGSSTGLPTVDGGTGLVGLPTPDASWAAESNLTAASFGASVAGAGDVNGDGIDDLVVGAFSSGGGLVFVYLGSAAGLPTGDGSEGLTGAPSPDASWAAKGRESGAQFGISVANAGDLNGDGYEDLAVGASGFDGGQSGEGAVFVYYGSPAGLSATDAGSSGLSVVSPDAHWATMSNRMNADFGSLVAGAGDLNGDGFDDLAVGARLFYNGETDEGAVFVYYGSASGLPTGEGGIGLAGVPTPDASWAAESNQAGARFGNSVAGLGDVNGDGFDDLGVGAYAFGGGEAFVFHGSGAGLPTADGGTGLIGIPAPDANWAAESTQPSALFGVAVAGAGDVNGDGFDDLLVGAYSLDNDQTDEGGAFLYFGSSAGLPTTDGGGGLTGIPIPDANWAVEGNRSGARFGAFAAGVGDLNGDGFDDVVVGAPFLDNGESLEGGAFAFYGSVTGLPVVDGAGGTVGIPTPDATWAVESNQADAELGSAPAGGDVNGDGFDDLVLGVNAFDSGEMDEGAVFVYWGSASGLTLGESSSVGLSRPTPDPDLAMQSDGAGVRLGVGTATADVNGDGVDEIVVGADGFSSGHSGEGAVYVYGDSTPPVFSVVSDGSGIDIDYQTSTSTIAANWTASDPETEIAEYRWAVGTFPGASNILPFTSVGTATSQSAAVLLVPGEIYYVTVRAVNALGRVSFAASDGVTVDTSAPVGMSVADGSAKDADFQSSTEVLSANWSFSESQSQVTAYEWAIGTSPGGADVQGFVAVGTATSASATGLSLSVGSTYYVTVRATNAVGLASTLTSDGIAIDGSLPTPGIVYDGQTRGTDIDSQVQTSLIAANWSGFGDSESSVVEYAWAVGTTAGASDVQPFLSVGSATAATNGNLLLTPGAVVYVTVRATNGAGASVTASSDGVRVSPGGSTKVVKSCGLLGIEAIAILSLWAVIRVSRRKEAV